MSEELETERSDRPGRNRDWKFGAAFGGAALVGVLVTGIVVWAVGSGDSDPTSASVCKATSVAADTLPSIVTISATSGRAAGTGSGEVIRTDGYILTNNHVISVAAHGGRVSALFEDGHSSEATIVGRDQLADLAVLKVTDNVAPVIPIASSADLQVGQPVIALGAPLGLSSTVTSGIVSALGRTIDVPADDDKTAVLAGAIQTDAAINPGNSGGALVDCSGKLVGVPTAGATAGGTGSIGLGFAIPSDTAMTIANAIIATGSFTHSYIGLQTAPVALSSGDQRGLFVEVATPNGPAYDAGLRAGDIVTEIDGQSATSTSQFTAIGLTKKPGEKVTMVYLRNGEPTTATVTLGVEP